MLLEHAQRWFPDLLPAGSAAFADLAFLDKETVRPWYGREVEGARGFLSSGTSGLPKPVAWTPAEDEWYVGEKRHLLAPWLAGCRRAFISLAVGHNAGSARSIFEHLDIEAHDAGLSSLEEQCDVIEASRPEILYCSPSILARLIAGLAGRGQRLRSVRRIVTNGEVLLESARSRAQAFFGVERPHLMDTYGSTEIGTIAHTCPSCDRYHFFEGLFPEPAPNQLAPAEDGGGGPGAVALAVSSIKRTSFPVVRLVTYDVVEGLQRVVCDGVERFSFDRILGRCDDVLNYGELFPSYHLADLIAHRLPAARWFVFNPNNDVTLVVEGVEPDGFREQLRARYPLHAHMTDLGLLDPPVIHFVSDFDAVVDRAGLPTGRSGKDVRRVLSRAADPAWFGEPAG